MHLVVTLVGNKEEIADYVQTIAVQIFLLFI